MNKKMLGHHWLFKQPFSHLAKCLTGLALLLLTSTMLLAEGSKDFIDYPGLRLFYAGNAPQQVKVYANAGEFINVGASHVGITGGAIRIYKPNGELAQVYDNGVNNPGLAIIYNDIEEKGGPTGGGMNLGGGYIPGVIPVGTDEAGIWTIVMDFPNPSEFTFANIRNDAQWTRRDNQPQIQRGILAWDVTISQNAAGNEGGTMVEGRVYSNRYESVVSRNGNLTSPDFLILTRDGFLYKLDFKDTDPWNFPLISNNLGIVNGLREPTYMSFDTMSFSVSEDFENWNEDEFYLYTPQAQNRDRFINNKIFFNTPNSDMPTEALTTNVFSGNTFVTWLFNQPTEIDVEVQDFEFTGLNIVDNLCPPEDDTNVAFLTFFSSAAGNAQLKLDINNDGDFNDEEDRIIRQYALGLGDTIAWNGLDGLGNVVEITNGFSLNYELEVRGGEIHVMMQDIENNYGGVTFELMNGANVDERNAYYFDHSRLGGETSGGGVAGKPIAITEPFTYQNNFGNDRMLDYWTYVEFDRLGQAVYDENALTCDLPKDFDEDGIQDKDDLDDDNDGIPDYLEFCSAQGRFDCLPTGLDPSGDLDKDNIPNYLDADDDDVNLGCEDLNADGVCDELLAIYDIDGDGHPNHLDLDSDNDGILDLVEAGHLQIDANNDGIIDGESVVFGANGFYNPLATDPDAFDASANYIPWDKDADVLPDYHDLDSDNDGIHDVTEGWYGALDTDDDGRINGANGVGDKGIINEIDPFQTGQGIPYPIDTDSDLIPDWHDLDSDNDGINDVEEAGYTDTNNDGVIGSGTIVVDGNGLAINDVAGSELETTSRPATTDGDAIDDFRDLDSDNDGINDVAEANYSDLDMDGRIGLNIPTVNADGQVIEEGELLATSQPKNHDGDVLADYRDLDSDNDGINDIEEAFTYELDPDNDGIIGVGDPSVNTAGQGADGAVLTTSRPHDQDGDTYPDYNDLDTDNDGIYDTREANTADPDGSGRAGEGMPLVNNFGQPFADLNNNFIVATSQPVDTDSDTISDYRDLDTDNDGINDVEEAGFTDSDDDAIIGVGIPVVNENGVAFIDPNGNLLEVTASPKDKDSDGVADFRDLDSDNDGINDVEEGVPFDLDFDNDGRIGTGIPTVNEHGQATEEGVVLTTSIPNDQDGDGVSDYRDLDTDNDGIYDAREADVPDGDGDGIAGIDNPMVNASGQPLSDEEGTPLSSTSNPTDTDNDSISDYRDLDTDNDGINDVQEAGLADGDDNALIGTGILIVDENGVVIEDEEGTTYTGTANPKNTDNDAIPDWRDLDADNDGINDVEEASFPDPDGDGIIGFGTPITNESGQATSDLTGIPFFTTSNPGDQDGDGYPDYNDLDTDNDGINDVVEAGFPDSDGDGFIGTGIPIVNDNGQAVTDAEGNELGTTSFPTDTDRDNIKDYRDLDSDNDGISDVVEGENTDPDDDNIVGTGTPTVNDLGQPITSEDGSDISNTSDPVDTDGDGIPDFRDLDADGDGLLDEDECMMDNICRDGDGDGIFDFRDIDRDNDGINDNFECENGGPGGTCVDTDNDGTPDVDDLDTDDDGIADEEECPDGGSCPDNDDDDIPEWRDPNCTPERSPVIEELAVNMNICTGDAIILTASNTNPMGEEVTYTWTGPDDFEFISTDTPESNFMATILDAQAANNGIYTLVVTGDNGCPSEPISIEIIVTEELSIPEITLENTAVCLGNEVTLSTGNYGENANYDWYFITDTDTTLVEMTVEPTFIITADSTNIGNYQVVVMSNTCTSQPSSPVTISLTETQEVTVVNTSSLENPACIGTDVQLSATAYENATYEWTGPNDFTSTEMMPLLENVQAENAGAYTVVVTVNGCPTTDAEPTEVFVSESVMPVLEIEDQQLCAGETLVLNAFVNNISDPLTYTWIGPNDFEFLGMTAVDNDFEISIPSVTPENAGLYTLSIATSSGCIAMPVSVEISVTEEIATPTISVVEDQLCRGEDILLNTDDYGDDVTYDWYFISNGDTNLIETTTLPSLTIEGAVGNNTGAYQVIVTISDCTSAPSMLVDVTVTIRQSILAENTTTANNPACIGNDIQLMATEIENATYEWFGPDGFNAMTMNPVIDSVTTAANGSYGVIVRVDGCVVGSSNPTPVFVEEQVEPVTYQIANAICIGQSVTFNAANGNPNNRLVSYTWTGPNGYEFRGTTLHDDFAATIDTVNLENEGIYTIVITDENGCVSAPAEVELRVADRPETPILVTENEAICLNENIVLQTTDYGTDATYNWYFVEGEEKTLIITTDDPRFIIENATIINSGNYEVVVNANSCDSAPSEQVNVSVADLRVVEISNSTRADSAACIGNSVQLMTTQFINAVYNWTGPNGFTSNEANPVIDNITLADAGFYTVMVVVDGCATGDSEPTEVFVNEAIIPDITGIDNPICAGETVNLNASNGNPNNEMVLFTWTGPNDYNFSASTTANDFRARLTNLTLADAGTYTLVITNESGCTSQPVSIELEVIPQPDQPTLNTNGDAFCIGQSLELTTTDLGENTTYEWYVNNELIISTSEPILNISDVTATNTGSYTVIVINETGCSSSKADPITVTINDLGIVEATNPTTIDAAVCAGDSVQLTVTAYPNATYEWTGPNGFTSMEVNPVLQNVNRDDAGMYSVTVTVPGCGNSDIVETEVFVNQIVTPQLENINGAVCAGAKLEIRVTNNLQILEDADVSFDWYNENEDLITTTNIPQLNLENTTLADAGMIYLIVTVNGCVSENSNTVEVEITDVENEIAQVTKERVTVCDEDAFIEAVVPQFGTGQWTTTSSATILSQNNAGTTVANLQDGENIFTWTLSTEACGEYSSAQVVVIKEVIVSAMDDVFTLDAGASFDIDLVENDDLNNTNYTFELLTEPSRGTVTVDEDGFATYIAPERYFGKDTFTYQICNVTCPNKCATATVEIKVNFREFGEDDCFLPNVITPNNDNKNDAFAVNCLETEFTNNRIAIFNRWGDKVFEQESYRNDWKGTYEGKPLPPGTYFYILFLDKDNKEALQGYFTLVR